MAIKFTNLTPSGNAMGIVEDNVAGISTRWLDAWGDVEKYAESKHVASDFTITATGTAPVASGLVPGTLFTITTAATDFSGDNVQVLGTHFKLETGRPCYFGARVSVSDATQSDLLVGLCGTDTTLTAASTTHAIAVSAGGVFFSKLDGTTAGFFKNYTTGTETSSAGAFTLDTNPHTYEFYWDGSKVSAYVDNVLVATFSSVTSEVLTPSIAFRAGEAVAKTATVYWMRAIQARS